MEEDIVDLREPTVAVAPKRRRVFTAAFVVLLCFFFGGVMFLWSVIQPPEMFPETVVVEIPVGFTARGVGEILQYHGIIRSPLLFRTLVRLSGKETEIQSGAFLFSEKMDLLQVTSKMLAGERGISRIRLTVPEGLTIKQLARLVATNLPNVSEGEFLNEAKGWEGYLFPDTYFFFSNATTGPVIVAMEENFAIKTNDLKGESLGLGKKWQDIVTMASIIEEETVSDVDQRMVSGILWNRINIGMRLQVDASFAYLLGKPTSEISTADLLLDSPYNTYRYAGLPPAPISNPGLRAIGAALYPAPSSYLYYLSDKDGVLHYAKTFEEHKLNKAKYLY